MGLKGVCRSVPRIELYLLATAFSTMTASKPAAALIPFVSFPHGRSGYHVFLPNPTEDRQGSGSQHRINFHEIYHRKPQQKVKHVFGFAPSSALLAKKNSKPEEDNDITILTADVFGVAVACQLLGLTDVLNDSSFWLNGGWFQPISAIPTSLSVLVHRISLNLLLISATSIVLKGYKPRSVDSLTKMQETGLRIVALYGLLRILIVLGMVLAEPDISMADPMLLVGQSLQEIYCVSLGFFSARYVVYLLYYR